MTTASVSESRAFAGFHEVGGTDLEHPCNDAYED